MLGQALLDRAAAVSTAAVLHEACTEHNVLLLVALADLSVGTDRSPQVRRPVMAFLQIFFPSFCSAASNCCPCTARPCSAQLQG